MYTAEDILLERERRIEYQEELVKQYKMPMLVIRVNYPGLDKDNSLSQGIIKVMEQEISEILTDSIHYKKSIRAAEGPIVIMCIKKTARDIKAVTLNIESNHILGRCVDIDVYDDRGIGISRLELGLAMRKCFICDDIAHNCVRGRKHSLDEVEGFIKRKFAEYMERSYEE
ncbi:citrate lyase holo-[acyl-carrier protein] synthase [Clostridium sp. CS001]|uniref:citrate lyase holo-[acyl-carrier protein] synthase n=1 Tax=Clostridium sp. CS001 TaxID=2880648 RepID=UPI001CF282B7|nr:citrate lyase holo-[acyl-carrier protein] synthase [Clostridium sp. CS001]MCB2290250.1 citrate lyase holo-[acyl-carrier protein] synthase [Clostridium sp. CS001]